MLARIRAAMEKRDEGFTLIELLVVMIIIGILAAIAIPVFLSQKKKAYETSLKSDLTTVATNIATATVDDPASITLTGTNVLTIESWDAAGGTGNVLGTYTVDLSGGNQLTTYTPWDATDGSYCVSIQHGTDASAPIWKVEIPSGGGSQELGSGDC